MTIYEREARFKLGPLEIGDKIGERIPNHGALFRYRKIHENLGESLFVRLLYRVPIINIPVS